MATTRREFLLTSAAAGGAIGLSLLGTAGTARGGAPRRAGRGSGVLRAESPLRILVLGGTGFIGPHIVRRALDRGHEVTLFNRGKTNTHLFPQVEKRIGDRDGDLESLESGEWDAVVDNSASIPRWVRLSAQLLKDRARQYLFTSSLSVNADFSQVGLTEEAPDGTRVDPTVEEVTGATYGGLKALCEQEAREAFPGRATIVRPHLIVGPRDPTDRWTYWPVRIDRGGRVLAPGTPDDPVQFIDARDLAKWYIHILENEIYGTFSAVGPEDRLTMAGMLHGIRAVTTTPCTFTWADADFLADQGVRPWSDMPAWLPPSGDTKGFMRFDNSKALAHGLTFRPLAETARDTLDWWATLPRDRRSDLRSGLAPEREAEILEAWDTRQG